MNALRVICLTPIVDGVNKPLIISIKVEILPEYKKAMYLKHRAFL